MKSINLTKFIRSDLIQYEEYKAVPSAYDISEQNKVEIEKINKLDANENIFGPSKSLNSVLLKFKGFQFYPDPEYKRLRRVIGKYVGIPENNIVVGSGGDELIDLLLRLILEPKDQVINSPPTFGSYSTSTFLNRGVIINIPRIKDFAIDIKKILNNINDKTKLIIICNPNNPTGNLTNLNHIIKILDTQKLVLIDEAYFEFSNITVLPLMKKNSNLIILRSFSKWAGIAGLRLGYLIASPFLINQVMKIKPPYNVNVAAELAGLVSLEDIKSRKEIINQIIMERERIYKAIKNNNKFIIYPSFGNYLFIQTNETLFFKLRTNFRQNKIAVRYYDFSSTGKAFRITIGTSAQNNKVIKILNNL
ncbi:histidinol-phosphate transaminase [Candidatus Roizmanbacteria bacterium CG2_30_33_16]|uniref:Histidinol-phosphate transaminase n=1 Tax=Candidatus Roizmanbacteria bacterium CG2_30_33_16 TaxID=1805340 RepID=A0A1J5I250_9BACT|nr:MAG: histidinol-phosphate transaminase [Candidatus Roizmanbacteria bacterium CG2_30_33_16]